MWISREAELSPSKLIYLFTMEYVGVCRALARQKKVNQFVMVNKYDFNYLFVEAVGGYFGLAFPLFSSGISHISKRLLFKFIHYAVADKRRAVFHYFCAYLHSV